MWVRQPKRLKQAVGPVAELLDHLLVDHALVILRMLVWNERAIYLLVKFRAALQSSVYDQQLIFGADVYFVTVIAQIVTYRLFLMLITLLLSLRRQRETRVAAKDMTRIDVLSYSMLTLFLVAYVGQLVHVGARCDEELCKHTAKRPNINRGIVIFLDEYDFWGTVQPGADVRGHLSATVLEFFFLDHFGQRHCGFIFAFLNKVSGNFLFVVLFYLLYLFEICGPQIFELSV